jgi:hypothetical protein
LGLGNPGSDEYRDECSDEYSHEYNDEYSNEYSDEYRDEHGNGNEMQSNDEFSDGGDEFLHAIRPVMVMSRPNRQYEAVNRQ